jgi:hypothetical protein
MKTEKSSLKKRSNITDIDDWVIEFSKGFEDPFSRSAPEEIRRFLSQDLLIPDKSLYRYHQVEPFLERNKEIMQTEGSSASNKFYWTDFSQNVEAYIVVTRWRYTELLHSAVRCLNSNEYVAAAVLARSALELGAVFVNNSITLRTNLNVVIDHLSDKPDSVVLSEPLEHFSLRIMWGTRLNNPSKELKQKNVLDSIKALSINKQAEGLLISYEYLCEACHPNVVGNMNYFDKVLELNSDGSKTTLLNRFADSPTSKDLIEKSLWALSWSCIATRNAYTGTKSDLANLLSHL